LEKKSQNYKTQFHKRTLLLTFYIDKLTFLIINIAKPNFYYDSALHNYTLLVSCRRLHI